MREHVIAKPSTQTHNFTNKLKTQKNLTKTPNLGLNACNAWERKDLKIIPQDWSFIGPKTWLEWRFEWEWEVWVERERHLSTKMRENDKNEIVPQP